MKFVAFRPRLPPRVNAGDELKHVHLTTLGMVMPEGRLAPCSCVNKFVNI
jgi:hypothetical protein